MTALKPILDAFFQHGVFPALILFYASYWLWYFLKRKPLQTGSYDNLVTDLHDRWSATRRI
uniref:Uncharacterized protein n=1 Tax=Candidatus Kentrum sp. MB TaxID=2138164 RepID=A0A450XS02_9GAMM|nr:MAG: hypothetical protein BECKMB1821G_GA0114241_102823 [Candidatus Kentron sp. MB]VFK32060.1 MAG: hypothetical protein BECKMB1821I_GA0114274_102922 [Candidatus Kentron sp. MB]VFK75662.1 MAG: hypothetical protein BECKMB1821H_GA0114242_102826 [Candidatus Kentron sp. MB]